MNSSATPTLDFSGRQALVLGLGESGFASARWLARGGAHVRVADTRAAPERLSELREQLPQAEFISGAFTADLIDGIDLIVVSPGLSPQRELAQIIPAAAHKQIPLWSEIELFAQALQVLRHERDYAPRVIAVTGTNGKTTVCSLTALLCERAGLSTQAAGNISPAALDCLREALDKESLPQVWVLELSSFQLHFTYSMQADVATVLNLSQDHLDWHSDMADYSNAKRRIFDHAKLALLNRDDAAVMQLLAARRAAISFGSDQPQQPDCFGLIEDNGLQWLTLANAEDDDTANRKRRQKNPALAGLALPVRLQALIPTDALQIRGQHNALNALAALALCRAIELPLAPLLHGLRDYRGEAHRVELVRVLNQVTYYDDSKGTNVGATVAALTGLGVQLQGNAKLLLIAGGEGKDQDFAPLAAPVADHVRAVLLIGRAAADLRKALANTGIDLIDCSTLEQAVQQAAQLAQVGDAVLLSPACASFDMFRNYAHRAEVFVDAVTQLALTQGELA